MSTSVSASGSVSPIHTQPDNLLTGQAVQAAETAAALMLHTSIIIQS